LYQDSFFYNGELQIDMLTENAVPDDAADKTLQDIFGINDETLAALRVWLTDCEQRGEPVDYDKIGQWLAESNT
jgi:hypothetical protein